MAKTPDGEKDVVPEVVAQKLNEEVPFDVRDDTQWRTFFDSIAGSLRTFGKDDRRLCEEDDRAAFGTLSVCGPDNRGVFQSKADTYGGMSGGPLNMLSGSTTWVVVGIVSHGDAANECRVDNGFTRLTQGRVNAITNWRP